METGTTPEIPISHSAAFVWSIGTILVIIWIPCFVIIFLTIGKLCRLWRIKRRYDVQLKRKESLLRENWATYFRNLEQNRIREINCWAFEPLVYLSLEERGAMNFDKLKREAARMISVDPQKGRGASEIECEVIFDYVREICDEKAEIYAEQIGVIRTVPNCRSEKIKVRRDTQVFVFGGDDSENPEEKFEEDCLHMTELYDYYGYSVYLSQAPLPNVFHAHWQSIWQEKIGVIVWIGALVELGRPKIDGYISMKKGDVMTCGRFKILTTNINSVPNEYDTYSLTVTNTKMDDKHKERPIFLFHVHSWPDHKQPHDPAGLANLLVQIQGRQLVADKEWKLPGLLVHCSLGVQRSPALVAAYIGRQMWMATRRVNPLGIFRYIRQYRFRAFTMGNPFAQVQIVFGVLQVIATRASKDEVVQKPQTTAEERDVFDRQKRLAEMSKQVLEESVDLSDLKSASATSKNSQKEGPANLKKEVSHKDAPGKQEESATNKKDIDGHGKQEAPQTKDISLKDALGKQEGSGRKEVALKKDGSDLKGKSLPNIPEITTPKVEPEKK